MTVIDVVVRVTFVAVVPEVIDPLIAVYRAVKVVIDLFFAGTFHFTILADINGQGLSTHPGRRGINKGQDSLPLPPVVSHHDDHRFQVLLLVRGLCVPSSGLLLRRTDFGLPPPVAADAKTVIIRSSLGSLPFRMLARTPSFESSITLLASGIFSSNAFRGNGFRERYRLPYTLFLTTRTSWYGNKSLMSSSSHSRRTSRMASRLRWRSD